MKSNGEDVNDDLQNIWTFKYLSSLARVGYVGLLLFFWIFHNTMNLFWVQVLSFLFTILVLADLFLILLTLVQRLRRCGDIYQKGDKVQESQTTRKEVYLDSQATSRPLNTQAST